MVLARESNGTVSKLTLIVGCAFSKASMTSCILSFLRLRWLSTLIVAVGSVLGTVQPPAEGADVASDPPQPVRSSVALLTTAAALMNRRRVRERVGSVTVGSLRWVRPWTGAVPCGWCGSERIRARRRGSGSAR
jgi:hypothetical protein